MIKMDPWRNKFQAVCLTHSLARFPTCLRSLYLHSLSIRPPKHVWMWESRLLLAPVCLLNATSRQHFETRNASVEDKHEAIDCTIRVLILFRSCRCCCCCKNNNLHGGHDEALETQITLHATRMAEAEEKVEKKIFIKLIKWREIRTTQMQLMQYRSEHFSLLFCCCCFVVWLSFPWTDVLRILEQKSCERDGSEEGEIIKSWNFGCCASA